jgi:hypothetical protein
VLNNLGRMEEVKMFMVEEIQVRFSRQKEEHLP